MSSDDTRDALPGMAFQIRRTAHTPPTLHYVGLPSLPLLGIAPDALMQNPALFAERIHPDDRARYAAQLADAHGGHLSFHWEGRVVVPGWDDEKWIDIRVAERHEDSKTVWDGLILNVTQSKQLEADLQRSRQELAALAAHADFQREQERANLARELHDDFGGNLAALRIGLGWIAERAPDALAERARYLDGVVEQTLSSAQRIVYDLRPPILDLGLVEAIRWLLERAARSGDLATTFDSALPYVDLAPEANIGVFRIVEEALANVARHAGASRIDIRLTRKSGTLCIDIADDGVGLPATPAPNFGLAIMAERAASLGGSVEVTTHDNGGTAVALVVPLKSDSARLSVD